MYVFLLDPFLVNAFFLSKVLVSSTLDTAVNLLSLDSLFFLMTVRNCKVPINSF